MIRLVLIRGLPGSGKSTLAKTRFKDFIHLEADMYFLDHEGVYRYDPLLVSEAHLWCENTACILLRAGQRVVVSNTFTRFWEIEHYLSMVNRSELMITEVNGTYDSIHGLLPERIADLTSRWEPLDPEYWEEVGEEP